jgi:hypothetical protein
VIKGTPKGTMVNVKIRKKFEEANNLLRGFILSVLADYLCDVYIRDEKKLWDAVNIEFDATNGDSELYIMEKQLSVYHGDLP